jgi:hypothetical protein
MEFDRNYVETFRKNLDLQHAFTAPEQTITVEIELGKLQHLVDAALHDFRVRGAFLTAWGRDRGDGERPPGYHKDTWVKAQRAVENPEEFE